MMKTGKLALSAALFGILVGSTPHLRADTPTTPEYMLKAAFIYNFALFTSWPERDDKLIHLCILGRDPFGTALAPLDGKELGTNRLAIHRIRSAADVDRRCQIVFVTDAEMDNFLAHGEIAREGSGVLTIGEREGSARQGMIIELITDDRKIGFDFNQERARQNRVQISSKLLRIARKIY